MGSFLRFFQPHHPALRNHGHFALRTPALQQLDDFVPKTFQSLENFAIMQPSSGGRGSMTLSRRGFVKAAGAGTALAMLQAIGGGLDTPTVRARELRISGAKAYPSI